VVVPVLFDWASPFEPAVLLIVATNVLEELQTIDDVRFCSELSENFPVAMNCVSYRGRCSDSPASPSGKLE
jgi:hypothetical protein